MDNQTQTNAWTAPELREESITDLTANSISGPALDGVIWDSTGTAYES